MKFTTMNVFSGKNTLLKVILLQALIIGATVGTVQVLDNPDISVYKSKDLRVVSEIVSAGGSSYWVSQSTTYEEIKNGSQTRGEFIIRNYYLSKFSGEDVVNVPMFSDNMTNYFFEETALDFNQSSIYVFEIVPSIGVLTVVVYETFYQMYPPGTEVGGNRTLNGLPTVTTKNTIAIQFGLNPLELRGIYLLNKGEFLDYTDLMITGYNTSTQLVLAHSGNYTELYLIDALGDLGKLMAELPLDMRTNSSVVANRGVDLVNLIQRFEPDVKVPFKTSDVKLVDSRGRIFLSGKTDVSTENGWTDPDYADMVMVDPSTNRSYFWQLDVSGQNRQVELIDLGERTMVFVDTLDLNSLFKKPEYWDKSPFFNDTGYFQFRRTTYVQYAVVDFASPSLENYVQFDQSVSQTESHTSLYPRLVDLTVLNYTRSTVAGSIPPRFSVVKQGDTIYLGTMLYRTSSGYIGDLQGCASSYGWDLVGQRFTVMEDGFHRGDFSGTLTTITRSESCDDKETYDEPGWVTYFDHALFVQDGVVYASVAAGRQYSLGQRTLYRTYIYRFMEEEQ